MTANNPWLALPSLSQRHLWRLLTLAAIVFSSGISGAWLNRQITAPLPEWWGWLGAAISGVAIFGGVTLGVQCQKKGWAIVIVAGAAAVTFDVSYFGTAHDWWTAAVLGGFPTLVAVLGGVVEATVEEGERLRGIQDRTRAWEIEQRRLEMEHEQALKLATIQAKTQARIAEIEASKVVQPPVQLNAPPVQPERTKNELLNDLLHYLHEHPDASLNAAAQAVGKSKSTIHNYVGELTTTGRLIKNGHGWEVR